MEKRVFSVIPTIQDPAATVACAVAGTKPAPLTGALHAAGTSIANFAIHGGGVGEGTIGVFNAATNSTVNAAGALAGLDFYLAVSTGSLAPGSTTNFTMRKTKQISRANVTSVTSQAPICEVGKEITLSGFTADCDTEYCIKIRYESEAIKQTYGYQDLVKTYTYTTSCCGDDCACPDGDCAELGYGIAKAVNDDTDNLVTAFPEKWNGAAWVAITDADFNTGILCTDVRVRFVGATGTFFDGCGPNPKKLNFVNTDFYIGLTCGFECNGSVADTQAIAFAEGAGAQVQGMEEYADGYSRKFGIYRIPFPRTVVDKLAVASTYYNIVTIEYNDVHDSANTIGQVASPEKVVVALNAADAASLVAMF